MENLTINMENNEMLHFEDYKDAVLNDYRIAVESTEASLLGRRQVLTGKAKFGVFRSRSRQDGTFLDIFSAVGPLGEAILERRQRVDFEGRDVWVITPEDLILLKAFSDRERDFEDLVSLLVHTGPKLDNAYVERWARALDESIGGNEVSERLERAQREAKQRLRKR